MVLIADLSLEDYRARQVRELGPDRLLERDLYVDKLDGGLARYRSSGLEWLVTVPRYRRLFTRDEINIALRRLAYEE